MHGSIFSLPAVSSSGATEVLLGIRPDDLAVTERESTGALEAVVSVIAPTGPINWVEVICNDVRLMGAAQPDAGLVVGAKAFVAFSPEKVHLFNATTGKRL